MTERRTRIGAYLVSMNHGAILLARIAPGYPGAGRWTLPGGGVEWGEHPDDALTREVFEETGFEVASFELLGIDSRVLRARDGHPSLHAIRFVYRSDLFGDPTVTEEEGSVDAADWRALDSIEPAEVVGLVKVGLDMIGMGDRLR